MIQIRRNTEEFAKVATLLHDYKDHPGRRKMILLYAIKPSQELGEKILINKLKTNATTLYNMSYDSILQHLDDRNQKLYREGDSGLYFFKDKASSTWIRFPFAFTGSLKKKTMPLRIVR